MSNEDGLNKLHEMLIRHEGVKRKPYVDCCGKSFRECECEVMGKLTIAVGRNIEDMGISDSEVMIFLDNDIHRVQGEALKEFAWFKNLSWPRQAALIDMLFIGITKFKKFSKLIVALEKGDFDTAASEMLCSHWAAQVGRRAVELADIIRTGEH